MEYKIGDRVVIIKNYDQVYKGFAGKLVHVDEDGSHGIEFDAFMDGHDCGGYAKEGFGYYVDLDCFELEVQPTIHTVKIEQNGSEYFGYAFVTSIKVQRDENNHKVIYADGIKIEFDEVCEVIK